MKRLFFLLLILLPTHISISAPRSSTKSLYRDPAQNQEKEELSDNDRDAMLVVSGMGILTAVVSALVDRHNKPHLKTQIFAALASLTQFISYMVRTPLTSEQEAAIVEQLVEHFERLLAEKKLI